MIGGFDFDLDPADGFRTLDNSETCRKLMESSPRAAIRIMEVWKVSDEQASLLLDMPEEQWLQMKSGQWKGLLTQDQICRIAALTYICQVLHEWLPAEEAGLWPSTRNDAAVFSGDTPLNTMVKKGLRAMMDTGQYLNAVRDAI